MSSGIRFASDFPPDGDLDDIIPVSGIDRHCSHPANADPEKSYFLLILDKIETTTEGDNKNIPTRNIYVK